MFDLFGFKKRKTQKRYTQRKMKDGNMHVYDAHLNQWILWSMLSDYEQIALINVPIQEDTSAPQDLPRFNALEDDLTESELTAAAKAAEEAMGDSIKDRQSGSFGSSTSSILDDNSPSRSSGYSSGSSYDSGSSGFGGGCSGSSGSSGGGSCGGGGF